MTTGAGTPRSRRALLAAGLGALGATVVSAAGMPEAADAASSVQLGASNSETSTTTIRNSHSGNAVAIYGRLTHATSSSGSAAIKGQDDGTNGMGVYGSASHGSAARGVYGHSNDGIGVYGRSSGYIGVYGSGASYGVYAPGDGSYGFYGTGTTSGADFFGGPWGAYAVGTTYGIEGIANGSSGSMYGVYGYCSPSAGTGYGVYGFGKYAGVYGDSPYVGIWGGDASSLSTRPTYGLVGYGTSYGVWATAPSGHYAVYASGDAYVSGTLTKGAGAFRIDHPFDPERKWLQHSFVESPDMKNVYDGIATAGAKGTVTVTLPTYFAALNRTFRYQLTALGGPAPALHIAREISKRSFRIGGAAPGQRVSWQVTGIRQDAYADQHRIKVETRKTKAERGTRAFVPKGSPAKRMSVGPRHVKTTHGPRQPLHAQQL